MGSTWRKAKMALGLKLCVYVPATVDDASPLDECAERSLDAALVSSVSGVSDHPALTPIMPTPTSSGLRISKSGSKPSKKTCAVCLGSLKAGQGHALFTAECSHTFHFHCITANVKHGNHICPVCRAQWKEIPSSFSDHALCGRDRGNPLNQPADEALMSLIQRLPRGLPPGYHQQYHVPPLFPTSEPSLFDDDEPLASNSETTRDSQHGCTETVAMKIHPEFSAIPQSVREENFNILIHLKAPIASTCQTPNPTTLESSRAPIDLVTVLDVSGSMSGTKLALLKRAMGFVIQNLGTSDRLSVIAFSSTARRLFNLHRMSESGRQQALQAVNSLVSNGGTNIAEGLRKGAKVIEERKEKNPVCSIILLSDGQDTYNVFSPPGPSQNHRDYRSLLPSSLSVTTGHPVPVHVFGFGDDHDSVSMHSISEASGGTFSYIEAESVIQDAFAQCIGGLLSVVVQEMQVKLEMLQPRVLLSSIRSGNYANEVTEDRRTGSIHVGDLYAEEERDFLVSVSIPPAFGEEMTLLRVGCTYLDLVSNKVVHLEGEGAKIQRPVSVINRTVSIEVDRQRNRLQAADAMAEARAAAERGAFTEAASILKDCRRMLMESPAGLSGDRLCMSLDYELREVQLRMTNQYLYEASGRAYVLSGLSSHSWQRATARGDSTDSTSLLQAYQTPSMVDMLQRSQTLGPPPRQAASQQIQPASSFPSQPQPR